MPKRRLPDSLLTKLENMNIGDQIWTKKPNGYVADNIATVKKAFPSRKFTQTSVHTHIKPFDDTICLQDFEKIIFITRVS